MIKKTKDLSIYYLLYFKIKKICGQIIYIYISKKDYCIFAILIIFVFIFAIDLFNFI